MAELSISNYDTQNEQFILNVLKGEIKDKILNYAFKDFMYIQNYDELDDFKNLIDDGENDSKYICVSLSDLDVKKLYYFLDRNNYVQYLKLTNIKFNDDCDNNGNENFLIDLRKYTNLKILHNDISHNVDILLHDDMCKIYNLSEGYNKNIIYPKNLKILEFNKKFNQSVDNLPENLLKLTFSFIGNFNHPINNLPSKLRILKLGYMFSHPIDLLPESIEYLSFSSESKFNHPIDNLPNNLKFLKLGNYFSQSIDNLPQSLTHLVLPGTNYIINKFPYLPNLINFEFTLKSFGLENFYLNKFIKEIKIFDYYTSDTDYLLNKQIVIPDNINKIEISISKTLSIINTNNYNVCKTNFGYILTKI